MGNKKSQPKKVIPLKKKGEIKAEKKAVHPLSITKNDATVLEVLFTAGKKELINDEKSLLSLIEFKGKFLNKLDQINKHLNKK